MERLNNITTHPDLNIANHIKDTEPDLVKEASWADYSSAKFLLLGYIVDFASAGNIHLIVMVQGGRSQQILERYFLGKGFVYTRPREAMGSGSNVEVSMVKGSLSFGIQTTQDTGILETYKRPSSLIALDATFDAKIPSVEHIRTTYARHDNLLPVIHLLVSNSSEHIGRCLSGLLETDGLRLLIGCTLRYRGIVGDLQDDALGVHEDAEEILGWLLSDNPAISWPLPAIEPLKITRPDGDEFATTHGPSYLDTQNVSGTGPSVQKRPLVGIFDVDSRMVFGLAR